MNISISTANLFYLPFETVLKIYKEAGYEFIELAGYWKGGEWEIAQHLKGIHPKDVIQMINNSGLKIATFHDMGGIVEDGAESVVSELTYEYMRHYDFPCLVFHTPHKKNVDKDWWNDYQSVLANDLKALDTLVCIENLHPIDHYFMPLIQPDEMLAFLDENGFYANIDTTHYAVADIDIVHAASVLCNRIKTVHISDFFDNKPHRFIGEGNLDFISFFKKINLPNLHSITIECDLSAGDEKSIIEKAKEAKRLLESFLQ